MRGGPGRAVRAGLVALGVLMAVSGCSVAATGPTELPTFEASSSNAGATRTGADEGALSDDCERLLAAGDLNALARVAAGHRHRPIHAGHRRTLGRPHRAGGLSLHDEGRRAGPGASALLLVDSSYTSTDAASGTCGPTPVHRGRRAPRPADRQRWRGPRRARRRGAAVGGVRPGHAHPDPAGPTAARRPPRTEALVDLALRCSWWSHRRRRVRHRPHRHGVPGGCMAAPVPTSTPPPTTPAPQMAGA